MVQAGGLSIMKQLCRTWKNTPCGAVRVTPAGYIKFITDTRKNCHICAHFFWRQTQVFCNILGFKVLFSAVRPCTRYEIIFPCVAVYCSEIRFLSFIVKLQEQLPFRYYYNINVSWRYAIYWSIQTIFRINLIKTLKIGRN